MKQTTKKTVSTFTLNGVNWTVERVSPNNPALVDESDESQHRLGVTWFITNEIYISNELSPERMMMTLMHELAHAYIHSTQVQELTGMDEEVLCDFVGLYADKIVNTANYIVRDWNGS